MDSQGLPQAKDLSALCTVPAGTKGGKDSTSKNTLGYQAPAAFLLRISADWQQMISFFLKGECLSHYYQLGILCTTDALLVLYILLFYEMLFYCMLKMSERQKYLPFAASLLSCFSLLQNDLVLFVLVGQYDWLVFWEQKSFPNIRKSKFTWFIFKSQDNLQQRSYSWKFTYSYTWLSSRKISFYMTAHCSEGDN